MSSLELSDKFNVITNLFNDVNINPFIDSPKREHYRNKINLSFGKYNGNIEVGELQKDKTVIPAKLIPNVSLTIGSDEGTAAAITEMGAKHVSATVSEIVVDNDNLVVSTPAYMLANSISELSSGIDALVDQVYNWAKKRSLSTSAAG